NPFSKGVSVRVRPEAPACCVAPFESGAVVGVRRCSVESMFVTIPLPCPPELMELALPLMQRLERAQHPALPGHTFEIHDWALSTAGRLYYSANDLRAAIASSRAQIKIALPSDPPAVLRIGCSGSSGQRAKPT